MRHPVTRIDRLQLIADELSATVDECVIKVVAGPSRAERAHARVWVFASIGLERVGQREMVLAMLQGDHREYPAFPFWLFVEAYRYAAAGTVVEAGGRTILTSPDPNVGLPIAGFLYDDHPSVRGNLPEIDTSGWVESPLIVVALLDDEIRAAELFGPARVLSLLGVRARAYPYPWWYDARREPVLDFGAYLEASILARVARLHAPYLEVTRAGVHLELVLPLEERERLYDDLQAAPSLVALLPRISTTADKTYIWQPGQQGSVATWDASEDIRPRLVGDHSPVSGNFLVIGHDRVTPTAGPLEDGFGITVPDRLWEQLLASIKAGRPFRWDAGGEAVQEVNLRFVATEYVSPFGEVYRSKGAFHEYMSNSPPSGDSPSPHNIALEEVVLLSDQNQFDKAVATRHLAEFIHEAELAIDDALEGVVHGCEEMVVEFRLAPNQPTSTRIAVRPDAMPSSTAERLMDRMRTLPVPPVRHHELRFQLVLRFP